MFQITVDDNQTITFDSLSHVQAWIQACAQTYKTFTMTIVFDINKHPQHTGE